MGLQVVLLVTAWTLIHVIAAPWGLTGVVTYYPIKYVIGKDDHTYDANRYFKYFIEFEGVYVAGPLATPLLIIDTCAVVIKERHARFRQKRVEDYLRGAVKDIGRDVIRISQAYEEDTAKRAAEELSQDLISISSAPVDKVYGSTSFAAISVLEDFAERIYRNDRQRLLWRIAESKLIVHEHRNSRTDKKVFSCDLSNMAFLDDLFAKVSIYLPE